MVYLYGKTLPNINDLVMVNVVEINELNIITKLIDFNDLTGYMSFGELSKKKRVNINTIVSVGKQKTAIVTNINLEKNYVELSLRNMSIDDIDTFSTIRKKYTSLYNLWRLIYNKLNPEIQIDDKYNNSETDEFELFINNTLREIETHFKDSNAEAENILEILLDKESNMELISLIKNQDNNKIKSIIDEYITIKTHIVKPVKDFEIKLSSYEVSGLTDLKNALDYKSFDFYKSIESDYDIEITYLSDSNYRINIKQIDALLQNLSYDIEKVYTHIINEIKNRCIKSKIIIKI